MTEFCFLQKNYKLFAVGLIALAFVLNVLSTNLSFWLEYFMGASSSQKMASPVVINATAKHTATVIFLHGLGDTGHGWSQAFQMMKQPHIKYICPTASTMPVTLNAGFQMPSWFDIKGLSPDSEEDKDGILAASSVLEDLVSSEEKSGIPRSRIAIGGFSQGGAVALYSALTNGKSPLAGIIALSSWLPLHSTFPACVRSNTDTDILQCHGTVDHLVAMPFGELTAKALASINKKHKFKTYPGLGHSSNEEELSDVKNFIDSVLPAI